MPPPLTCVMLVDDDATTNYLTKRLLTRLGVARHILDVTSGEQALLLLNDPAHPTPDLILLDVNMPGLSGWEFLSEFRRQHPNHPAIITILSTAIELRHLVSAQEWFRGFFFDKPLTEEKINQVVRSHF